MTGTRWPELRSQPPPPEGTVVVWRADLDAADDALARLLSPDEVARAARFVDEGAGRRWARTHGILRALLAAYLDADPRALRFVQGPHGKPELAGPPRPLHFNLSHSAGVALYAFATGAPVGVDIEVRRRPIDPIALAERGLGSEEARRIAGLEPAARVPAFLRAWARHEATLKCLGIGIAGAEDERERPSVWVADVDVGPEAAAAVAVQGGEHEVLRHEWPPAAP